jgi:hypothetical protein
MLASRSSPVRVSKGAQRAWLEQSKNWADLPWNLWQPVKVLGAGSSGIVGLWRWLVPRDLYPPLVVFPTHVVVKQSNNADAYALGVESEIMLRLLNGTSATDQQHFIKLYKAMYRDPGGGTSVADESPYEDDGSYLQPGVAPDPNLPNQLNPDPNPRDVARIFMEYVRGGDMIHLFNNTPRGQPWLEEDVSGSWRGRLYLRVPKEAVSLGMSYEPSKITQHSLTVPFRRSGDS